MRTTNNRIGDWKETYTGKQFYILDPRKEDFCIQDIAHSLALQCRYNGHCMVFYSVAEHCCLLSDYSLDFSNGNTKVALQALMHDAVEAYFSDVPSPIKATIPQLEEAELTVEKMLMKSFGLPFGKPAWLRDIDGRIILDERDKLMCPSGNDWNLGNKEPLGVKIEAWNPARAEFEYLKRFEKLYRGVKAY